MAAVARLSLCTAASLLQLLVAGASVSAETTAELRTQLRSAYGTGGHDFDQVDLLLQPRLQLSFDDDIDMVLSARLRWSATNSLRGEKRQRATYAQASKPAQHGDVSLELRDAYVERSFGRAHLRLGKQQIVWGALDGLKLLDSVNPQDFREFILDDFDASRISQWAAYLEVPLGSGFVELAIVPDTTVHELPGPGAKFAFTASRFQFGLDRIDPTLLSEGVQQQTRRPSDPLEDGTWAARYTRFGGGWDFAASVVNGVDHAPVAQLLTAPNGGVIVERSYRKRTIVGFSAEKSFGSIALRTEMALRPQRAFNRVLANGSGIEIVRRQQLGAALAMDWQAPGDLFVNVQLLHEQIRKHDSRLTQPRKDTLATMLVRRDFRYDTLTAELRWYGNLADGDGLLRPSLSWQVGDNSRLRVGADIFYGSTSGLFGQYRREDQVSVIFEKVF